MDCQRTKGRAENRGQQLPKVSLIGDLVRAVEQGKHLEAEAVVGLLHTQAVWVCFGHLVEVEFTALLKADALQAEIKPKITLAAAAALVWCHGRQDSHLLLHPTLDWANPIQSSMFYMQARVLRAENLLFRLCINAPAVSEVRCGLSSCVAWSLMGFRLLIKSLCLCILK